MAEHDHTGRRNPLTRMMVDTFDNLMRQCMFCLPGRIMAFDPETQLAQVECGIQRLRNGTGHTIPVIQNVPVKFAGDGDFYFWHQITTGETTGIIHFSQRAIDTWIDQGGPVAPHEARILTEDDAFFVPGIRPIPGAIPNFKNDGAGISNYAQDTYAHLKSDGTVEVVSAADTTVEAGGSIAATAEQNITAEAVSGNIEATAGGSITAEASTQADVTAPTINLTGTVNITGALNVAGPISGAPGSAGSGASVEGDMAVTNGDVTADGISLKTHTHPGDSGGTTGQPQ